MNISDILPIIIAMILVIGITAVVTIALVEAKYTYIKARYEAERETMKRTGYHPLICNGCKWRKDLQEDPKDYPKSETWVLPTRSKSKTVRFAEALKEQVEKDVLFRVKILGIDESKDIVITKVDDNKTHLFTYEVDSFARSITDCPHKEFEDGSHAKVGSFTCVQCEYYRGGGYHHVFCKKPKPLNNERKEDQHEYQDS